MIIIHYCPLVTYINVALSEQINLKKILNYRTKNVLICYIHVLTNFPFLLHYYQYLTKFRVKYGKKNKTIINDF